MNQGRNPDLCTFHHNLAEGAGAAALAAAVKTKGGLTGQRVVAVMSGGNLDATKLKWILQDARAS